MSTFHVMSDRTMKFTYFFFCGKSNTFQKKKISELKKLLKCLHILFALHMLNTLILPELFALG